MSEEKIPSAAVELAGDHYMTNGKGALVPLPLVKAQHLLEDEMVRKVLDYALRLSAEVQRFKRHTFADINGYQALLEQEYGSKAGGAKGNVSYHSYDRLLKVQVSIADIISFGPELQEAKKLVDEVLTEWGAGSRPELRAFVNRAFNVDKEGLINRSELFAMLRYDVKDPRWQRAMDAIRDAISVDGTKVYVRFYIRASIGDRFEPVTIDLAAA